MKRIFKKSTFELTPGDDKVAHYLVNGDKPMNHMTTTKFCRKYVRVRMWDGSFQGITSRELDLIDNLTYGQFKIVKTKYWDKIVPLTNKEFKDLRAFADMVDELKTNRAGGSPPPWFLHPITIDECFAKAVEQGNMKFSDFAKKLFDELKPTE